MNDQFVKVDNENQFKSKRERGMQTDLFSRQIDMQQKSIDNKRKQEVRRHPETAHSSGSTL